MMYIYHTKRVQEIQYTDVYVLNKWPCGRPAQEWVEKLNQLSKEFC